MARGFRIGHPKQYWINCASGVYANAGQDMTIIRDSQAPTVPGTPVVTVVSANTLSVSWAASTDNLYVSGYQVRRNGAMVATTALTTLEDGGLTTDVYYAYDVRAFDAAGNYSAYSGIGGGTPIESPGPDGTMHFGANVSQAEDYTSNRNFINMNLDTSRDWWYAGTTVPWPTTQFKWPTAVPNGTSLDRIIRFIDTANPALVPAAYDHIGTYKIVCQENWTPSVNTGNSYGITQLTSVPGSCTFTINVTNGFRVWSRIRNDSGVTQDMAPGTYACYQIEHEAAWLADPFAFLPEALVNYQGFSVLRFATTSTVNAGYNWPDAASIVPKAAFMGGSWPPEIQAKLARECNAGMWLQLPTWIDRMNTVFTASNDIVVRCKWPQIEGGQYRLSGTAGAFTSTSVVLPTGASASDSTYNGKRVYIASATTGAAQSAVITAYVGSTRTATVASWPSGTPTGTARVVVNPEPAPANGTQMMFVTGNLADLTAETGLTQIGPYVVLAGDGYGFKLATLAAPSTPINLTIDTAFTQTLSEYRNQETNWTTYVQRHFNEYPNPPSVQAGVYLECWNPGYLGLQICMGLGNYVRSGSLTGGALATGHGELTLRGWRVLESIYSPSICKRMVETGISAGNSGIMDVQDINSVISTNVTIASRCTVLSIATYYAPWETAIPPIGTVDWYDPIWTTGYMVNAIYGANPTMNESSNLSASGMAALWASDGPLTGAEWATTNRQFFHFLNLHCRLWRNKMDEYGRVLGTHYTMEAYETGNHMRIDRSGGYVAGDTTELIQTSFINWNYGNDPTAVSFRAEVLAAHQYNHFTLAMHYHLLGDWVRSSTQVNQWGALAFHGAETVYPNHAHYYNFLKANV